VDFFLCDFHLRKDHPLAQTKRFIEPVQFLFYLSDALFSRSQCRHLSSTNGKGKGEGKEPVVAGRERETEKGEATDTDKKSFNYATGEIQVYPNRSTSVYSSVSDSDWIRIQSGQWIRIWIRIRSSDPDPGGQKWLIKVEKKL
jgi:hypothetical protein